MDGEAQGDLISGAAQTDELWGKHLAAFEFGSPLEGSDTHLQFLCGKRGEGQLVLLLYLGGGVGNVVGTRAVVGEEEETGSVGVEATYGDESRYISRYKLGDRRAVAVILEGRQVTLWFIQGYVGELLGKLDGMAIEEDAVGCGYALAEGGDTIVDLDASGGDQGLCLAARWGGSAASEEGLEAHYYYSSPFS